jgi:hypothetical protein
VNLARYPEALPMVERYLASAPADARAAALRALIQLEICARERRFRAAAGDGRILSCKESAPLAAYAWQALTQPDLVGRLTEGARTVLHQLVGHFESTARGRGFSSIAADLGQLAAALREPATPPTGDGRQRERAA